MIEKPGSKIWQYRNEGREEGRKEAELKIAQNLLKANNSVSFVARATELSEEEVSKLAAGMKD